MNRKECINVLEKYCDVECQAVREAHEMAIEQMKRKCKNCHNINHQIRKYIDGKVHASCDLLGCYVDIERESKPGFTCWTDMWDVNQRN